MASELDKLKIRKNISNYKQYVDELFVDAIIKPVGRSKESYAEKFLAKYLTSALKDSKSREAQYIASILIKPNVLDIVSTMQHAEEAKNIDFQRWLINNTLYDKQQEVFSAVLHNAYKKFLIINSRRSGKTELLGRLAVSDLLNPGSHVVYINRNSSAAIRQIRGPLNTALAQTNLKVIKGSIDNQELYFDNGSMMLILGNNNSSDVDKVRGERISLCILDECGHQRNMKQLVREVLEPAMMDYGSDSKLVMVGTPPRIPHTYVEECYNEGEQRGWKVYHWTFLENPHIKDRDKVIEEVCKENGCTEESAFIQREYYGRMDAYDTDSLVIKKYNFVDQTQLNQLGTTIDFAYVCVDWGWEDKPAVVSMIVKDGRMYITDCWSENHNGIQAISQEILRQYNALKEKYNVVHPIKVIADNNEKGAVWDLYDVYRIPNVNCAYKSGKSMALEQLNDLFSSSKITISNKLKDSALVDDLKSTVWIRDEETDKVSHKDIDDSLYHPNALIAVLYGSRDYCYEVLHYVDNNKMAKSIVEDVRDGR